MDAPTLASAVGDGGRGPRTAIVRLAGQRVGEIVEAGEVTRFTYDVSWLARADAVPVSLTLPLREEPYDANGLHPFFENLLPEGWLLQLSTTKLKIPPDDAFGLLMATCADCAGAVEILAAGQEAQAP
jgi:serine/threonine-protein kinase HipA